MKPILFLKNYYKNNSKFLILSILLFFTAIFVFYAITDEIVLEKETNFDDAVFLFFKNFIVHQHLNETVVAFTKLSSPIFIKILFPLILILLLILKKYRQSLFLFLTGVGGILLISTFKIIFARARPPYPLLFPETGFSFPSGHATFSFIFYGALAYLIWLTPLPKFLKLTFMILLVTLSLLIGISRIYLRVHYPSDVLAGFCLGYSWLLLMIYISRKWFPLIKAN